MGIRELILLLIGLRWALMVAADNAWIPGFTRLSWVSSIVTPNGKWLYVDGGEVWNGVEDSDHAFPIQSTVAIDLSVSWTNRSLPISIGFSKPSRFPFSRAPTIWYSQPDKKIYSYGGEVYETTYCPGDCNGWTYSAKGGSFRKIHGPERDTPLWELQVDNNGFAYGAWTPSPSNLQPGSIAPPTLGGLATTAGGEFWNLGGFFSEPGANVGWSLPGLVTFNSQGWSNMTTSPIRYSLLGQAIFAPSFGTKGVLIFVGGYSSPDQYAHWGESDDAGTLQSMDQIYLYDIGSRELYEQTATGDIPYPRFAFCAVNVEDEQGHLDIFVYGGYDGSDPAYGDMHILSIPSFEWTRVGNGRTSPRTHHTCELAGGRQMVVVGGSNGFLVDSADPFTNAVGVYYMLALQWSSRYDADAQPYERSEKLAKALSDQEYPSHWDHPELAKIFALPQNRSHNPSSTSSSSNSAIIGGAVGGGVAAILILGLIICFCVYRRRKKNKNPYAQHVPNYTEEGGRFEQEYDENAQSQHVQTSEQSYQYQPMKPSPFFLSAPLNASQPSELDAMTQNELPASQAGNPWETGTTTPQGSPRFTSSQPSPRFNSAQSSQRFSGSNRL